MLPFFTIESDQVYNTVQQETCDQYVVRLGFAFQSASFVFDGKTVNLNGNVPLNLSQNALELLCALALDKEPCHIYMGCNSATDDVIEAIDKLPHRADLVAYLFLLFSFAKNSISYEVQDIIKIGSKNAYKDLTIKERFEKIQQSINSQDVLVIGDRNNLSMVSNPIYKMSTKSALPMVVAGMIDQHDNLYYKIDIYGNKMYTFFHPYIKEIRELTGIDLRNPQPMIFKEYEQAVSLLQNL